MLIGKEFRNMRDMCEQLGLQYKDSTNSRKAIIKEIEQYVELQKKGQKFTIVDVYNSKVNKIDNRGLSEGSRNNNSIYAPYLDKIIGSFIKENDSEKYFTLNQLADISQMVNSSYQSMVRNKDIFSAYIRQEYMITNSTSINNTFRTIQDIIRHAINGSIERLTKEGVIYSEKGFIVIVDDIIRMATSEEDTYMKHVESLAMQKLNIEDKVSFANKPQLQQEFYELTDRLFKEKYINIVKIFKGYELVNFHNFIDYSKDEKDIAKFELNKLTKTKALDKIKNIHTKALNEQKTKVGNTIFGTPKSPEWFTENIMRNDYIESSHAIITMLMDLNYSTETIQEMRRAIA